MSRFIVLCVVLSLLSCSKMQKKEKIKVASEVLKDAKGVFEAVFIDINDTIIPLDIDPDIKMDRKLLSNLNLRSSSDFWGDKTNFYMHVMGSIDIPESQYYNLRVESSGGIVFKINNKDAIVNKEIHNKEVDTSKTYIHKGSAIFEMQYFSGAYNPYFVFEWSKDGENYEVIPDSLFRNLDAYAVKDWEPKEIEVIGDENKDNNLSEEEIAQGWQLLFDGESLKGWHTYNKPDTIGEKWKAQNGMLIFEGRERFEFFVAGRKIEMGPVDKALDGGGDIVTDKAFENFILTLEWKISEAGNNGIFYTVQEEEMYDECWKTSPEMQVLDNQKHKDGLIFKHRTGDLYDLLAFAPNRMKPQGQWNKVKIVKNKGKVEHWLNGMKVLEYERKSDSYKKLVAESKYKVWPNFGEADQGHILLQDHGDRVAFKNIKIRPILSE